MIVPIFKKIYRMFLDKATFFLLISMREFLFAGALSSTNESYNIIW